MSGLTDEHPWLTPSKTNVSTLINTNDISLMFRQVCDHFDKLYEKYSFAYWFVGEGLESGEMAECREDIEVLIRDYEEVCIESRNDDNEEY